ncbi:MAG: sporulation protein YqfD [Defluviitaleaceae bacterium]|nr:sporulation protein YqfD [Defluviitaleaceae bacterium]
MQYIWNFLRGFVLVKITGLSVERFINVAAFNGVNMWDIFKTRDGIVMKVSVKEFKKLKDARRKTGVKLKIISKTGVPFFLFRYRKRKLLLGGVLFFLFTLYFMSSFIWLIDIEGTERIEVDAIIESLNREGLTVGAFKNQISPNDIENILLEEFDDISWVNIHIRGTRAHITLTEILPKPEVIDRGIPTNVIASKSGVITRIATSAGTPLRNVGDLVQVGEILVSGEVIVKQDESGEIINFVHAESEVWARVNYEINFLLPYEYIEKQFTGRTRRTHDFIIFGKKISLINIDNYYTNYDRITSTRQLKLGENYPLPIITVRREAREFMPIVKRHSPEQARETANRMITSRIIREFDFETDIIDKIVNFTDTVEGLQVDALITVIERIDVQEELEY